VSYQHRTLLALFVPYMAVVSAIPVERPDPQADRTPLAIEVLNGTILDRGDFSARIRFHYRTRSPISVTGPVDQRGQCIPSPVPVIIFVVSPERKRGVAFPCLIAETPNNRRLALRPGSQVMIAPRAWIDVDFTFPTPMGGLRPLTIRCVYINPRPDRADSEAGRLKGDTFFGQVMAEPFFLPERKVGS
jgi:hypothetical protein